MFRPLRSNGSSTKEFYIARSDGYEAVQEKDINMSDLDNAVEYYHCKIGPDENGVTQIKPMPYRAVPYPRVAVKIQVGMRHKTLDKVWAISSDGKYTFFSNENTEFNLVCCQINDKESIQDRVTGKLFKGYDIDNSINIYDADERDLV